MFEEFLHNHGVYEEYMDEFDRHRTVTIGQFYNSITPDKYIIMAFEWDKTEKGFKYWSDVNNKWVS